MTLGPVFVRPIIDPFRVKRLKPKYEVECDHFREHVDGDSGYLRVSDLHTTGNTLSELIENAQFWEHDGYGCGGRNVDADGTDVMTLITLEFLNAQELERRK